MHGRACWHGCAWGHVLLGGCARMEARARMANVDTHASAWITSMRFMPHFMLACGDTTQACSGRRPPGTAKGTI
eukprot:357308-Chlamydomonas_euryale.AAC.9